MNRLALLGAAAVLVFGGVAIAQTPAPATAPEAPAATAAPEAPVPEADVGDDAPMAIRPGMGRPDGMGRGMGPGMGRGPGMGMMRPGGPMMPPPADFQLPDTKGAVFVFDGPHRGRIIIKCADADSTQACAEAVKPLLDTITADRGPGMGHGPGMGMGRGPGGGPGKGAGPCMGQGPGAGMGQGMGRGPCGGGMGPGGPGAPAAPAAPSQAE